MVVFVLPQFFFALLFWNQFIKLIKSILLLFCFSGHQGDHGITEPDLFLSLPRVIDANGVQERVELHLSDKEKTALQKSVEALKTAQDSISPVHKIDFNPKKHSAA